MIYEIALLPVHKERIEMFQRAFAEVAPDRKSTRLNSSHWE